ncbi:hypothetical protein C8Q77DRAFT_476838 [Trametes polyzona]|nr:hypothetical protein C8Q77DRAFT_476838 [Trametes polyzona]
MLVSLLSFRLIRSPRCPLSISSQYHPPSVQHRHVTLQPVHPHAAGINHSVIFSDTMHWTGLIFSSDIAVFHHYQYQRRPAPSNSFVCPNFLHCIIYASIHPQTVHSIFLLLSTFACLVIIASFVALSASATSQHHCLLPSHPHRIWIAFLFFVPFWFSLSPSFPSCTSPLSFPHGLSACPS